MTVDLAAAFATGIGLYLLIGLVFGIFYVTLLVGRLDPNAKGMALRVRLLILPGLMLLWPFMLIKTVFWKGPPAK